MKSKVTIGADPEILLTTPDGKAISAIGKIGGSKRHPLKVSEDICILEDNVSAEYTIAPCTTQLDFIRRINRGKMHIKVKVRQFPGVGLSKLASMDFDGKELDNPIAMEFGCDPDMNAWTGRQNPRPDANTNMRSAGGHVHVGYDDQEAINPIQLVRALDLFLGIPSVLLDNDTRRRQLYGRAGCFRKKPYGVEYRTLSNFWIHSEDLIKFVYQGARKAVAMVEKGFEITVKDPIAKEIISCIDNSDRDRARRICEEFEIVLPIAA